MMKSKGWARSSVVSLTPDSHVNSRAKVDEAWRATRIRHLRALWAHWSRDFTSVHDMISLRVEVFGQQSAKKKEMKPKGG